MYIPEYTITNKILDNITIIEYLRAVAETQVILPSWEKELERKAQVQFIKNNLNLMGIKTDLEKIKKYLDGIIKEPAELIKNIKKSMEVTRILSQSPEMEEEDLQTLYKSLHGMDENKKDISLYRENLLEERTKPEELLAEIVSLFDWLNSLDGKETHPLIKAAIVKAQIIKMMPFKEYNELMSNLMAYQILKSNKYDVKGFCHLEVAYCNDPIGYKKAVQNLLELPSYEEEEDLTAWIDFYLGTMASAAASKKEEILLLSKDTKIATATGRSDLSKRQEKIVRYLKDYGLLQNKDFPKLFPNISEDTVLRELKKLMKKDIVVKKGKTKSSRYVLK